MMNSHLNEESVKAPLSLDVVTDAIRFGCLREEWEQLEQIAPVTPFQTFDWSYLWWRYFGGSRDRVLHVVLFRDNERIVGIGPLFLETSRLAGKELYRRLRFLGCDIPASPTYRDYPLTDYLDFIVAPGREKDVARTWVRYLEEHPKLYDEAEFVNLQSSSFLISDMVPEAAGSRLRHRITRSDVCPRILLQRSFDEYLNSLDGNHRRRLRQVKRASQEEKKYVLEVAESEEDVREAFKDLVNLHQKRWNKLGSPGLFYEGRFEMFQKDILEAFRERNQLWISKATAGDRTLAVRMCFSVGGILYDYLSGVDDESGESKHRPGLALLVQAIETAIQGGMKAVDLLRGGEQYKLQLASEVRYNWNVILMNPVTAPTARVRCAHLARRVGGIYNRILREKLMITVFSGVYGLPQGIRRYVGGRIETVRNRIRARGEAKRTPAGLGDVLGRVLQRMSVNAPLIQRILKSLERDKSIPFARKVFKGFVFLKALLTARIYLRKADSLGRRCRTRGRPYVVNDGRITIGDDFNLSSRIVRSELATGYNGKIEIGNNVRLNFGALLSSQELVKIGNNVRMGPYAIITDSDFHSIDNPYSPPIGIPTIIEDNVWLGARVTILKGSRIGEGSVVSAGSVVSGVIPPNVIAAGNPARVVRPTRAPAPEVKIQKRNGSLSADVIDRVTRVFARTFCVEGELDLSWGPTMIPQWDSLGHLNLILNLESEFKIRIPDNEVSRITTIGDACRVVEKSLSGSAGTTREPHEFGQQR